MGKAQIIYLLKGPLQVRPNRDIYWPEKVVPGGTRRLVLSTSLGFEIFPLFLLGKRKMENHPPNRGMWNQEQSHTTRISQCFRIAKRPSENAANSPTPFPKRFDFFFSFQLIRVISFLCQISGIGFIGFCLKCDKFIYLALQKQGIDGYWIHFSPF